MRSLACSNDILILVPMFFFTLLSVMAADPTLLISMPPTANAASARFFFTLLSCRMNGPAYEPGPCDCGWSKADTIWWRRHYHLFCIHASYLRMSLQVRLRHAFRPGGKSSSHDIRQTHCRPESDIPEGLSSLCGSHHTYGAQRRKNGRHRKS